MALSQSGMVTSRHGSVSEMSGTSVLPMRVAFSPRPVSVITANCETSAPVPAVVGAATRGGMGRGMRSMPS